MAAPRPNWNLSGTESSITWDPKRPHWLHWPRKSHVWNPNSGWTITWKSTLKNENKSTKHKGAQIQQTGKTDLAQMLAWKGWEKTATGFPREGLWTFSLKCYRVQNPPGMSSRQVSGNKWQLHSNALFHGVCAGEVSSLGHVTSMP